LKKISCHRTSWFILFVFNMNISVYKLSFLHGRAFSIFLYTFIDYTDFNQYSIKIKKWRKLYNHTKQEYIKYMLTLAAVSAAILNLVSTSYCNGYCYPASSLVASVGNRDQWKQWWARCLIATARTNNGKEMRAFLIGWNACSITDILYAYIFLVYELVLNW
jgi:hypothetical protein